ncbi:6932_t:CDS:2, partial [Entrophospora sp. SA101]
HVDHNNNNNSQIQMGKKKELMAEQYGQFFMATNEPLFDSNAQASLKKIITQNSKHRRLTTRKIQELWIKKKKKKVSTVTIHRTLKKVGLRSCVACSKPLISENNKTKRLAWALERKDWTIAKWKKIVWSDESTFSQFSQGRSLRVWHTPEEEFDPSCLTATVKHRQTYAKVLQKHAIPSLYKLVPRNQGIFQEDNAPPHRSKIATDVSDPCAKNSPIAIFQKIPHFCHSHYSVNIILFPESSIDTALVGLR